MSDLPAMLGTLRRFLRRLPFGFNQETFRHSTQVLYVHALGFGWWEVYRWPVGTGSSDVDDALKPLPVGSPEALHRIGFNATRIYRGRDFRVAMGL